MPLNVRGATAYFNNHTRTEGRFVAGGLILVAGWMEAIAHIEHHIMIPGFVHRLEVSRGFHHVPGD